MRDHTAPLERPVLVVDGWVPVGGLELGITLRRLTSDDPDDFKVVSYAPGASLERLASIVVARVEETWPSDDPEWTTEVDVVGFSAGGLVARLAALRPPPDAIPRKRLRIRRLFTLSTPHRGTVGLARLLAPDPASREMRPGSTTITMLDEALADAPYELYCYGQVNDQVVSVANTSPEGVEPIWTYGRAFASHSQSARNMRIVADIAARLRGDEPMSVRGVAPPGR